MPNFYVMGAESVAYHRKTVVERSDDYPGKALNYYGSRGETPVVWGGRLAPILDLGGETSHGEFDQAYAPGGFRHPRTGEQLTSVTRPGFEWVISHHKSIAVLGVIGRADDMHAIADAARGASLAFAEDWWIRQGGSRGRAQTRTPTEGLLYCYTRHGTTRAGDPHPHDHILIANITLMADGKGGWKALDSAALRDLSEAASMVGHLHAAWKAVELGYAIEADGGRSGRARDFRILGIPAEVCEVFSKRSDEIAEYLEERGQSSYRAASIAARATRKVKRHTGVDELMPQWHDELQDLGWSVERLAVALDHARSLATGPRDALNAAEIGQLVAGLMDPDSHFMTNHKVFTRWNLIEEIAPHLYGCHPDELGRVLDHALAHELVVPLIGGPYSRQATYASALVLAREQHIADTIDRLTDRPGPDVPERAIREAIAAKQAETGHRLTPGQGSAVYNICGPIGAVKVVVGIAGSGKTTALDAASRALEDAGYQVVGTATSGQAARTLGTEADIDSRTAASLLARIHNRTITLTLETVLVLDEAGMTADADLGALVHAVTRSGARVVLVGDPRQLAPVGPGGALAATLQAHPEIVTVMRDNVRQTDPAEAAALLEVRHGDPTAAVAFYETHDRIRYDPKQLPVLHEMVKAWAADTAAGHDTLMLAFRRETVRRLNAFGRVEAGRRGWLQGENLEAPGGRLYALGDQIVTLAPNYQGDLVTSQRGTVSHVDHHAQALTIATDDNRQVVLTGRYLDHEHLDHGYALTVHRTQGATSDRAHYLAEGAGREHAYVGLSRARHGTTVHVVADDIDQVRDDLTRHWGTSHAQDWITLTHQPAPEPAPPPQPAPAEPALVQPTRVEPMPAEPAPAKPAPVEPMVEPVPLRPLSQREAIAAELERLNHSAPPDVTTPLTIERLALDQLRKDRADLETGQGTWRDQPEGHAPQNLDAAERRVRRAEHDLTTASRLARPRARAALRQAQAHLATAQDDWTRIVPIRARQLDEDISRSEQQVAAYEQAHQVREAWLNAHPDTAAQIAARERELLRIDHPDQARMLDHFDRLQHQPAEPPQLGHERPSIADDFML